MQLANKEEGTGARAVLQHFAYSSDLLQRIFKATRARKNYMNLDDQKQQAEFFIHV
jgi:hypothetical protein